MSVIFASYWMGIVCVVVFCLSVFAVLWRLAEGDGIGAVVFSLIGLLFGIGFFYQQTHFIVQPNRTAIVVDKRDGQIVGGVRSAGVSSRPLWTSDVFDYPAQSDYQWCPTLTPSIQNGVGVTMDICFTMDANAVDWGKQYRRYNGNGVVIVSAWQNELQPIVAASVSSFSAQQLTNERDIVTSKIFENARNWFSEHDIVVTRVSLRNWQFTSEAMNTAFENAQLASTKIDVASAELQAAQIQLQTASVRKQSCEEVGLTSESACLQYLQLIWLSNLPSVPQNLVISIGDNTPNVSFPVAVPNP